MWDLKTDHNEQLVSELNASGQNLGNSNDYRIYSYYYLFVLFLK